MHRSVLIATLLSAATHGAVVAQSDPVPPRSPASTASTSPASAAPAKPAARPKAATPRVHRGTPYATREDAMKFADELAQKHNLDAQWARKIIGEAQQLPIVSRLMQPAASPTAKNWRVYRSRFIDPIRIDRGVRFWQQNREALERAESEFGVPAEMIVGIIGVETIYGQQMGDFRVIDALATLSFDFPDSHPRMAEREKYFRGELEQFILSHAQARSDPFRAKGSYAGAMGMPQFMPSSIAKWAVDYDGDKIIDLVRSPDDVIGSVANYFRSYGWKPGMPTHYPVAFDKDKLDMDALMAPDILPTFSVASFQSKGAVVEGKALEHKGPLALIELLNGPDAPQYVAGTENFYVITRYNWSSYYAMAVIDLGREVKEAYDRQALARGKP